MRHLNRPGGAASNRRNERTRAVALVATFLLLAAGGDHLRTGAHERQRVER